MATFINNKNIKSHVWLPVHHCGHMVIVLCPEVELLLWEFSCLGQISQPRRHLVVEAGPVLHVVAQVFKAVMHLSPQGRGAPVQSLTASNHSYEL